MFKYLFCAAVVAIVLSFVVAQDFGFPEETGLPKDKQNANVRLSLPTPLSTARSKAHKNSRMFGS